jgi:hypothetical protein
MAKRGPKGPTSTSFKPGASGNPGGKPRNPEAVKKHSQLRDLCRQHVGKAIDALLAALEEKQERVRAADILLAYGYGRPQQTVNVRRILDIGELDDEELLALAQGADAAQKMAERESLH